MLRICNMKREDSTAQPLKVKQNLHLIMSAETRCNIMGGNPPPGAGRHKAAPWENTNPERGCNVAF